MNYGNGKAGLLQVACGHLIPQGDFRQNRVIRLATTFPYFFSILRILISICCEVVNLISPELVSGEKRTANTFCDDGNRHILSPNGRSLQLYSINNRLLRIHTTVLVG